MNHSVASLDRISDDFLVPQVSFYLSQMRMIVILTENPLAIQIKIQYCYSISADKQSWHKRTSDITSATRYQDMVYLFQAVLTLTVSVS